MPSNRPASKQDQPAASFADLRQLTDKDRAALAARNILTVEEFLKAQKADEALLHHLGLPDWKAEKRVADAIVYVIEQRETRKESDAALAAARLLTRRPLQDHLPDLIVAVALLLLAFGVHRALKLPQAAVTVPNGLMAFQLISPDRINGLPADALDKAVGRYSRVSLLPGAAVDLSKLSSRPLSLNAFDGRRIFHVKLQPSAFAEGLSSSLPVKVSIMISPREQELKGMLMDDIYLLDEQIQADGISAVIATSESDAQTLASLNAKSELNLVGPAK